MNHNHLPRADRERLLDRLDELADLGRLMRQPGLLSDAAEAASSKPDVRPRPPGGCPSSSPPRKAPDVE